MVRALAALAMAAVLLGACQCLVPVAEGDGGHGAGGGAGGGSGGGSGGAGGGATGGGIGHADAGECTTVADCRGAPGPALGFCGGGPGLWSCAFGRCVTECSQSRTCVGADAGCMRCDTDPTLCPHPAQCPTMTHLDFEIGSAACPEFSNTFFPVFSLSSRPCTYGVLFPDGGTAGTITFYGYNDLSADFPFLGGACIGEQLPTGALRFSLSCPACMASVRPEVVGP